MPLCAADEQMFSEFTPQVTKACGVFVIMGLLTTFIRFLRTSPQETARRRGQRQPITLRFPLALLGRFRIRPVTQSTFVSWTGQQRSTSANHAARFALAFLGRFRIRPVTQSTFVSWTGQQRGTGQGARRCIHRMESGKLLSIVTHPDGLAGGLAWFLGADIDDVQNMLRSKGLAD